MAELTSPAKLDELADVLLIQERYLRNVLDRLRQDVRDSVDHWKGNTAETFRNHAGHEHRQYHLEKAADRLHHAARLARAAAVQNQEKLTRLVEGPITVSGED